MATYDYSPLVVTATRLIAKFGASAIIRRPVAGTVGDAWTTTEITPVDHACTAVLTDYNARDIDGSIIQANDRRVLIDSSIDIEPNSTDSFVSGGIQYAIISVNEVNPGGVKILYQLQVRR